VAELGGRVALVTGTAGEIGAAIAEREWETPPFAPSVRDADEHLHAPNELFRLDRVEAGSTRGPSCGGGCRP
jgi:hypothetical protein